MPQPANSVGDPVRRRDRFFSVGLLAGIAGLLAALLALPVVLGVGLVAKAASDHFEALPSVLVEPPLPQRSLLLAADGSTLATLHGNEDRVLARLADIPAAMQQAIVAIEDSRFYAHKGVDLRGTLRALVRNSQAGTVQQGGSTLTQQYVKNVLLESASTPDQRAAAIADTSARKLREARYALALEQRLSKSEILERYLNIAYFGNGVYGVGTAAQHYFAEPVDKLTLAQATLLAGLVNNPTLYDPVTHPDAATERRDLVLARMVDLGMVSAATAAAAKATPVAVAASSAAAPLDACQVSTAPFFCAYVKQQLEADPALGGSLAERDRKIYEGGLVIRTTLDPAVQSAAQAAVDSVISRDNRVAAPVAVVRPGTGEVLALAVNRNYGDDTAAMQTKEVLQTALVQPGSTFKMFTLVAALEDGYGLGLRLKSPACYRSLVYGGPPQGGFGTAGTPCPDGVANAGDSEAGTFSLPEATWHSVNTFYVQLEERVGVPAVVDVARRMGVPASRFTGVGASLGSLTIGGKEVSPLDMATAYATLAAHGKECDPRAVASVIGQDGKPAAVTPAPPCRQAIRPEVADTATSVLAGVIQQGTGFPNATAVGRPAAGKTGTTDNSTAAWFVGFTPQLATAVELSDPRGAFTYPLPGLVAAGRHWGEVFGGDVPALIWGRVMSRALSGVPVQPLAEPDATVAAGHLVPVPRVVGLSQREAAAELRARGYAVHIAAVRQPGPAGVVAKTVPDAGTLQAAGITVNLVLGG